MDFENKVCMVIRMFFKTVGMYVVSFFFCIIILFILGRFLYVLCFFNFSLGFSLLLVRVNFVIRMEGRINYIEVLL